MFKKIFSKKSKNNTIETNVLVAALLVHAAQIDERYTEVEKQIIKKALVKLYKINDKESEDLISKAEKIEQESNQIIEFTQEIKKNSCCLNTSILPLRPISSTNKEQNDKRIVKNCN